jgi:t-SNARE complex subunit (syntaxin)
VTTGSDPQPTTTPVPTTEAERARLRAELQELRTDMGDTVAELTERVDVPARAKAQARQTVDQARLLVAEKAPVVTAAVRERPIPAAAIAAGALLIVIALLVRRRRSA